MNLHQLVSNYTHKKYRKSQEKFNESNHSNILNQQFHDKNKRQAVVSDLTYVRVKGSWCYICIIVDLYNREIIGHSVGKRRDAELVKQAITSIRSPLSMIEIFHTDRGLEFKNGEIDGLLKAFDIKHSLSRKGTPYDNAVSETTFKAMKTEFINQHCFSSMEELRVMVWDYVNWYNNHRIHGSLGYVSPREYLSRDGRVA